MHLQTKLTLRLVLRDETNDYWTFSANAFASMGMLSWKLGIKMAPSDVAPEIVHASFNLPRSMHATTSVAPSGCIGQSHHPETNGKLFPR